MDEMSLACWAHVSFSCSIGFLTDWLWLSSEVMVQPRHKCESNIVCPELSINKTVLYSAMICDYIALQERVFIVFDATIRLSGQMSWSLMPAWVTAASSFNHSPRTSSHAAPGLVPRLVLVYRPSSLGEAKRRRGVISGRLPKSHRGYANRQSVGEACKKVCKSIQPALSTCSTKEWQNSVWTTFGLELQRLCVCTHTSLAASDEQDRQDDSFTLSTAIRQVSRSRTKLVLIWSQRGTSAPVCIGGIGYNPLYEGCAATPTTMTHTTTLVRTSIATAVNSYVQVAVFNLKDGDWLSKYFWFYPSVVQEDTRLESCTGSITEQAVKDEVRTCLRYNIAALDPAPVVYGLWIYD
ncbi:hypothetical protein EK21DRAFT_95416 [Setomelanomma holmii]|uniref:Uncharacterized protein n=1 Tax=Setomelanomma holmii TaxID=210430 RepID=A0A9P4GVN0_9PLEO|nr:hypothetical protein EK21DRAFT_95416 [Setomelanomma holmii]